MPHITRTTVPLTLGAIVLLAVGAAIHVPVGGGEFDRSFSSLPGEIHIGNPGPPVTPTIYVVGIPDRSADRSSHVGGI